MEAIIHVVLRGVAKGDGALLPQNLFRLLSESRLRESLSKLLKASSFKGKVEGKHT